MYQPGEEMPMSPGYPGAGYYPPANMYGMPYPGMGYMGPPPPHGMMMPPPGYEHPQQFQQQQHQGGEQEAPIDGQQDPPVGQGEGNGTIPPAEVSKSIPCKFFPNCRYGAQCAFQHPAAPPPPAFSPPPMPMYGFEQGSPYPPPFYPMGPPFGYSSPPLSMGMAPPMHSVSPPPPQGAYPPPPPATTVDYSNDPSFVVNPQNQGMPPFMPSAMAPPFAPAFQPAAAAAVAVESDAPQTEHADASDSHVVQKEDDQVPQQQQQQQGVNAPQVPAAGAAGPKPFARSKFGPFGGPFPGGKKFGPKASAKWVGGNAPPCSFFLNNACRNGDMCRFPHLNAEGVDCRNPGVIDGTIAAAPISVVPGKPTRAAPYAANNFPLSSKAMQTSAANKLANRTTTDVNVNAAGAEAAVEGVPTGEAGSGEVASTHVPNATTPAFVPARHLGGGAPSTRPFAQARSQPGSRPLSPTGGPNQPARNMRSLSANTVGGARRKDDGAVAGSGVKDVSSVGQVQQRVPSSDDFPALGGSVGSLRESTTSLSNSVVVVPSSVGKTAAQVLSAPAPAASTPSYAKPTTKKAAVAVNKEVEEAKERQASKSSDDGQSSSSGKTSDSEDAVVVESAKSAPSAPNGAPSPLPVKKIPSFAAATMVGAIKA